MVVVIGMFVLIFLVICGMGFLIFYVIRKSTKKQTPQEESHKKQEMLAYLKHRRNELEPWGNHSYLDITAQMKYTYKKTTTRNLKGTLLSPSKKPIMAYYRFEKGLTAKGYMMVGSSDFVLYFDLDDMAFPTVKLNNKLLGRVDGGGNIFNAENQQIGRATHPTKVSWSVGPISKREGASAFPLHMNNRVLAVIRVAPNYGASLPSTPFGISINENPWGMSILDMQDEPKTQEEKDWLLALAVLEIAFHGHWAI